MQEEIMDKTNEAGQAAEGLSRRRFLTYAGALAGAGMLIASCNNDDDDKKVVPVTEDVQDLGTGDYGSVNYMYAMDQLSAAFFTKVIETPFVGIDNDLLLFQDIAAHSIAHRELLKSLLGGNAIPGLEFNLGGINFRNKSEVLFHSGKICDIVVKTYTSANGEVVSNEWKSITSKIASVKSKHDTFIRELSSPGSFADGTDENGMEPVLASQTVLDMASGYFVKKLSRANFLY